MSDTEKPQIYLFGEYRLNVAEETLWRNDEKININRRTFQVLKLLIERAGEIVSKQDFFEMVWTDAFVEDNVLTVTMTALRKALGDDPKQPRFIENLPRKGYRFIDKVQSAESAKPDDETILSENAKSDETILSENAKSDDKISLIETAEPSAEIPFTVKSLLKSKSVLPAFGALILLLAAVFGIWHFNQTGNIKTQRKLAVLPFNNLQPNAEIDYLGYALADSIIAKLAPIKILGVRSSQSISKYVNQKPTPTQVADELQADLLLTGTYQKINDKIYFKVQLVDVSSNEILYFDNFDVPSDQLSEIQERLARRIISELGLSVSGFEKELLRLSKPHNEQAYKLYLQGVDDYAAARFPQAIETLEQSIKADPDFARAWDILGASYMVDASTRFGGKDHYDLAERAFKKSLELNPNELQPRVFLSDILIETNRVEEAVEFLRDTISQNPDDALAHWELSYAYRYAGFLEDSKREGEFSQKIDPGFTLRTALPNYYLYLKEYEKYKNAIPARFDSAYFEFYRGFVNYHLGDFDDAKIDFDKAYDIDRNSLQSQIGKALSFKIAGDDAAALKMLNITEKEILSQNRFDAEGLYKLAQGYAALGEKKSAIRILKISIDNGFFAYPYIVSDPLLENLRDDSEYQTVLRFARKRHEDFRARFFKENQD